MTESFSSKVKKELLLVVPKAKHCRIAESTGISLFLATEVMPEEIAKKYFTLLDKTITIGYHEKSIVENGDTRIVQQSCCKQAFLRGAFLVAGSVNDPGKSYHLEIICKTRDLAEYVSEVMGALGVMPKIIKRKEKFIAYLKEADQIVEALGVMGASVSLMEMENTRILKEVRGNINRAVNCETANISKTVNASMKQIEDIEYIHSICGLSGLPPGLIEVAKVRKEHPQMSLQELGKMLDPPVGKSGVNHRLRRISKFAEELRNKGEMA